MKKTDDLLKDMAMQYAEQYGVELQSELEQFEQDGVPATPELDARIKREIQALESGQQNAQRNASTRHGATAQQSKQAEVQPITQKRKRRKPMRIWVAAAAACIALLLIVPMALRNSDTPKEQAAQPNGGATQPLAEEPQAGDSAAQPQAEQLPIAFSMPAEFTVSSVQQDKEKTVYYLANAQQDDVVMTLQQSGTATEYAEGELHPVTIEGQTAYGIHRAEYSVLTFEHGGIRYTLTCSHDFRTLVTLGESILI